MLLTRQRRENLVTGQDARTTSGRHEIRLPFRASSGSMRNIERRALILRWPLFRVNDFRTGRIEQFLGLGSPRLPIVFGSARMTGSPLPEIRIRGGLA